MTKHHNDDRLMTRLFVMGLTPEQVSDEMNIPGESVQWWLVENASVVTRAWSTTVCQMRAAQFAKAMRGDCTAAAHLLHQRDTLMERMGRPTGIRRRAGRAR